jgi:molybdopterin adenylyltransferase
MPGFAVVTISDRCFAGQQVDATGPAVARVLTSDWPGTLPTGTIGRGLVPDNADAIATLLHELCHQEYQLILTAGGTGLGPRDVTPEATRRVIDREAPGLAEAMRAGCASSYRYAWLSRAVAGLCGKTLIVNLPGSERGAVESLSVILPLLPHALDVVAGSTLHPKE